MPTSAIDFKSLAFPNLSTISKYPALTVGLAIFTFVLLIIDLATSHALASKLSLYPGAPFHFDLNRLSFYPLFHQGFIHWVLNVVGLFTPMAIFERSHGTVYTGVTLNLLAVTAALQYCIVGSLLCPNTHVIGLSGIVFSFFSYIAYKEHELKPVIFTFKLSGREYSIPTLYSPFVFLVVTFILLPSSSLFGHLAGIGSGYLLGMDKLKILYPPSKIILFIEQKLQKPISLLDGIVVYYKEEDAIATRGVSYNPLLSQDVESAVNSDTLGVHYRGEGHVLGNNTSA